MRACGSYCCCLLCGSGGSSVAVAQGFQFRELSNKGKGKGRGRKGLRNKGLFSQTDSYCSRSLQCLLDAAYFEIPNVLAL